MAPEKALRATVLTGLYALPFIVFVVSTSLFFPFITGKNFLFRIIIEVITGAWFTLALVNPVYRPRRQWLLGAFAIFVVIVALADVFGVYPFKSIWSNFERMDGLVTLAHLFLYFTVASVMLSTEKLWRAFWHVTIATSVVLGLYAFLQLFGVASLNPGFSSTERLDATYGNPIYLAAHMLFLVFITGLFVAREWKDKVRSISARTAYLTAGALQVAILIIAAPILEVSSGRGMMTLLVLSGGAWGYAALQGTVARARLGLLAALFLFITVLFLTGTRGAMLGLAGGTVLASLLIIISGKVSGRRALLAGSVIAGIVLCAGLLFVLRNEPWVREAPFVGRLATISLEDSTTKARIMNWGIAWDGFKERPLLGWGQENFAVVFNKHYNPDMYAQEQWFDRVHNVLFDWLIAGGILGLLAYLSLYVLALGALWRRTGNHGAFAPLEASILTGLLAAYFFHNLFVFDNVMSYVLFATVLAYIASRSGASTDRRRVLESQRMSERALPIILLFSIVVVGSFAWYANARPIAQNRAVLQGIAPQAEGIEKNLEAFERAVSYDTFGTQEAREQLMQLTARMAGVQEVPLGVKERFVELSARELSRQVEESPLDPRAPLFLGSLLDVYGLYAQAQPVLLRAHELAPKKQSIIFELAANTLVQGDLASAEALYKEAFELAPEYTEARIFYAAISIRRGAFARAQEILEPIIATGQAADMRIVSAYIATGNMGAAAILLERVMATAPEGARVRAEAMLEEMRAGISQS